MAEKHNIKQGTTQQLLTGKKRLPGFSGEWGVQKLGSCLIKNPEYGINAPAVPYSDNLPVYIRITDISEDGRFLPEKKVSVNHPLSANYVLEANDLLLARTGASTGKSYLYNSKDGELVFAGFLIRVKVNPEKLDAQYLKGFLQTKAYWNWVGAMSMRSGQPGINGNEYAQLPIPLPPTLEEQKAIAQALSDAGAAIAELDCLITKKRNIKQGTMQQLLTSKKRLPGFSGEWVEKELKSIIKLTNGFAFKSEFFAQNGPIILTPGNFKLEGGLYFNERNTKRYSGSFPQSAQFNYGDLLIVMTDLTKECNLLGKPAFVNFKEKILHNQRIAKIQTLSSEVLKKFLFYFFLSNYYHLKIKETATGSTVRHTSPKSIYAISILLPPTIEEQEAIAQVLIDMDAEIEALEQKRDKYKAIKQGMMQELFTGRTRLI